MRGQHLAKIMGLFGVFLVLFLPLFAATPLVSADSSADPSATTAQTQNSVPQQCQTFATNSGYFFDDYESHDYSSGFLAMHFRLKQPHNDGRPWTDFGFYMYDQACNKEFHDTQQNPHVTIDSGVQLYSLRFSSATHYDFWNDESDVREQCDGCSGDISPIISSTQEAATSVSFYARIDGDASWLQSDSFTILPPQAVKTPVLIIPGILGTEMSFVGTKLWPNVAFSAISDDSFMDPLQMDSSGQPLSEVDVGEVISALNYGLGTFDYAGGLATALEQQGYVDNSNLFFFPYDWRKDPGDLEAALQTEINHIAELNPSSPKIDIVAHSYGGLLLKHYILQTSDPRIGKIIFVGVPQMGTPEAAQALMFGDDLGIPILNGQEIFKLAQNMPMIYDLLPSQEYYSHTQGFFDDLSNVKVPIAMGYGQAENMMLDMGKNLRLLNQAQMSHTGTLDNMDFTKLPYDVSSIIGCGLFTEKTIDKMYNGDPTPVNRALWGPKYRIEGDSGDGTVVVPSAAHDAGTAYYVSGIKHAALLSNPNSLHAIISLLNGQIPDPLTVHASSAIGSACDVTGKLLSFSSNVNIVLTNRSTGIVLTPRQDYSVIQTGNDRHIFVPEEDLPTYAVQVQSAVAGGSPENVSIHDITTNSGANHNTYNYNNIKLNGNLLGITFPKTSNADGTSSDGQDLETINPNTGDSTTILPSDQLDGSYNNVSGDGVVPGVTSSTGDSVDNNSQSITPSSIQPTDPSTIIPDTGGSINQDQGDQDNGQTLPSDTDSTADNTSSTVSGESSDVPIETQTETIGGSDGQPITINITNAGQAAQSPVNTGTVDRSSQNLQSPVVQYSELQELFNGGANIFVGIMKLFFHIIF